jgi:hypothetical protein
LESDSICSSVIGEHNKLFGWRELRETTGSAGFSCACAFGGRGIHCEIMKKGV